MNRPNLVSTDWLVSHLDDPSLRIVDIRGHVAPPTDPLPHYFNHHADYGVSHVPGAVFVDWVREITDPDDPQHAKVAKPDRYATAMSRAGISANTFVVAYDDAQGMFAARLWFTLNYYGHAQIAILDGGWQKWLAEGCPVTDAIPLIQNALFEPNPQPNWLRQADEVDALINGTDGTDGTTAGSIWDVRSPAEFSGQASRAKRKGHIPSAINLPRTMLTNPDGTLLPSDVLRERFAQAGVNASTPDIVCYCNGGVSASYALLALRTAGFQQSTVYDGSWKEWGNDDSRPIE